MTMAMGIFKGFNFSKLLLAALIFSGCAGTNPYQNVPAAMDFEKVMLQIATNLHTSIKSASAKGTIPPSLDVGVADIREQNNDRSYLFGEAIRNSLAGKLRQISVTTGPGSGPTDINYLEVSILSDVESHGDNSMGNTMRSHLYKAFTNPNKKVPVAVIASTLGANLIIQGNYRLLSNQDILISLHIVIPQQNRIIGEKQIRLRSKGIQSRFYRSSFSEGIEKEFKELYGQIKVKNIDESFSLLNLKWKEEFTWKQQERMRLLFTEKVDKALENLIRKLIPYNFSSSFDIVKKEWDRGYFSYEHQAKIQKSVAKKLNSEYTKMNKILLQSDFNHFLESSESHRQFLELLGLIKKRSFWEVSGLLERRWSNKFTDEHRKKLIGLIHKKLAPALEDLGEFVPSLKDLRLRRVNLRNIKRSIFLRKINYIIKLSDEEKVILKTHEKFLFLIEKAIRDGFKVTVKFIASTTNNEPLGFSCEGLFSNKKVSLTLNKTKLSYANSTCKADGTKQMIVWPNPFHLFSAGKIKLRALEKNLLLADKKFSGSISVKKEDLLQLYQKTKGLFPIQGSDYSIQFTRLN